MDFARLKEKMAVRCGKGVRTRISDSSLWVEHEGGRNVRVADTDDGLVVSYWDGETAINVNTLSDLSAKKAAGLAKQLMETAASLNGEARLTGGIDR